jgi:starch-binding outer membrane protein, SusD/RagB family
MIRWLLLSLIPGILGAACTKVLDLSPENSLTYRNGLVAPGDFEAALRGAAQFLMREARDVQIAQQIKGEFSDAEDPQFLPERFLSPDFIKEASWTSHYAIIAQANMVLKYVDRAEFSDELKAIYKGQALFYKSLAYFELIRQFGDCILVEDEVDPHPRSKSSWTVVADHAIVLAEQAVSFLPVHNQLTNSDGTAVNKTAPSRGAANALLAHLCAWKAGCKYFAENPDYDNYILWRTVEDATSAIIDGGNYSLAADPKTVVNEVLVGNSNESIFETAFRNLWSEMSAVDQTVPYLVARYYHNYPVNPGSTLADHGILGITNHAVNKMYPGNDWRKDAYFYDFVQLSDTSMDHLTNGLAYPYKYREIVEATGGWFGGQMLNFNVDKVWWRLADIILLRAEARMVLGETAAAISDLNTIRMRSGADLYDPSEYNGDLRLAIFREREKELLMEGHRYYDVIRNGYASTELKGGFQSATAQDFRDGAFFLNLSRTGTPNDYDNNPKLEPNKYWARFY